MQWEPKTPPPGQDRRRLASYSSMFLRYECGFCDVAMMTGGEVYAEARRKIS